MLCKFLNKIDLVLFHILVLLLSHTDTIIYWTNNRTLTGLFTLPVLGSIKPVLVQVVSLFLEVLPSE